MEEGRLRYELVGIRDERGSLEITFDGIGDRYDARREIRDMRLIARFEYVGTEGKARDLVGWVATELRTLSQTP